jgi:hypothetical protein
MDGDTQEKHDSSCTKRYKRMSYKEWTYQLEINKAAAGGDKASANRWRKHALKRLIGFGETGLYPDFEAHDKQREAEIIQYANILAEREIASEPELDTGVILVKKLPKKFRDVCTLILSNREQGVHALADPAFDAFAHQRDAIMAELAYFDGDFEKALQLDMSICPWWSEWHYCNVCTEHIAAMSFAAFRLSREAELIAFFKEQITWEQFRAGEKEHIIRANVRYYESQIEKLIAGYETTAATPRTSSLFSQRVKDGSPESLIAYTREGLWRIASVTQVRPMEFFCYEWLYKTLTDQTLRDIAAAIILVWK